MSLCSTVRLMCLQRGLHWKPHLYNLFLIGMDCSIKSEAGTNCITYKKNWNTSTCSKRHGVRAHSLSAIENMARAWTEVLGLNLTKCTEDRNYNIKADLKNKSIQWAVFIKLQGLFLQTNRTEQSFTLWIGPYSSDPGCSAAHRVLFKPAYRESPHWVQLQ